MLVSLDAKLRGLTLQGWVRRFVLKQYGESVGAPVFLAIGTSTLHPTQTAAVRVNQGRWIVDCPTPECKSAQLAHRTDRRFFCVDCLNAACDRLWIPTVWPQEASEIEAVLMLRLHPHNRNWAPPETLDDLRAENLAHGIGAP